MASNINGRSLNIDQKAADFVSGSGNFVSGQETLFGYQKQSFGLRKLPENLPIWLAIEVLILGVNPVAQVIGKACFKNEAKWVLCSKLGKVG